MNKCASRCPAVRALRVIHKCVTKVSAKHSATGTRTRVFRVRAEHPHQLDYGGCRLGATVEHHHWTRGIDGMHPCWLYNSFLPLSATVVELPMRV